MVQEGKDVTPFGTVTSDSLIYNVQQSWFGEKLQKEIPLHQVAGAKLETKRHPIFGILLVLGALAYLATDRSGMLIMIVPLGLAVLLLWGSPLVRVKTTTEGDLPAAKGPPWTRPEAEWFVAAVNRRGGCAL